MNFVFWHSYLMFHQAAYIRELANIPGNTVHWCVEEALPRRYRERGYPVPDTGQVQVHVAPTPAQVQALLAAPEGLDALVQATAQWLDEGAEGQGAGQGFAVRRPWRLSVDNRRV